MTVKRAMVAPRNLQFFISDPAASDVPIQGEPLRIISSGEIISVPCRYWDEGDTELVVGGPGELDISGKPQFEGTIPTPHGVVLFSDVEIAELMSIPTATRQTRIRIWTDGELLPERVMVEVG